MRRRRAKVPKTGFRTRHKGDDHVTNMSWNITAPSPYYQNETITISRPAFRKVSDMTDCTGPLPRIDQPCVQEKAVSKLTVPPLSTIHFQNQGGGGDIVVTPPYNWELPVGLCVGVPDIEADRRRFLRDCAKWFQDQFRSNVSLANFLIELTDFKDLLKRLGLLVAPPSKFFQQLKKAAAGEARDRARSGVGGQYLDYVFNWKQLINDVPKLLNLYKDASNRLDFLLENSTYVDHKRRRFEIQPYTKGFDDVLVENIVPNFHSYAWTNVYRFWLRPDWCQVTMDASAHVENKLNKKDLVLWNVLADQAGLNNSPKILWNATKLSWLVDFFIDSHEFFNAFEVQAAKGHLGITGGTASVKVIKQYKVTAEASYTAGIAEFEIGTVIYTSYRRDVLRLIEAPLFSFGQALDVDQKLILASLAESRAGLERRLFDTIAERFRKNKRTFGRTRWKR